MHYLLLKRKKSRTKAEVQCKKYRNVPKAERKNALSSCSPYFACQPEASAKYNISWIKDRCSAHGNVSSSSSSNSGIKVIVAYLDQRWAELPAVKDSGTD